MASTLGTHKLRTVFFHFGEWTTYVDHTRETNDTKKDNQKIGPFFRNDRNYEVNKQVHSNLTQTKKNYATI